LKNDFFGFPKVKSLQYTGEVGKCTIYWRQLFSGFNTPIIIKIGYFLTKSFEKYNGGRFLGQSVYAVCSTWAQTGISQKVNKL